MRPASIFRAFAVVAGLGIGFFTTQGWRRTRNAAPATISAKTPPPRPPGRSASEYRAAWRRLAEQPGIAGRLQAARSLAGLSAAECRELLESLPRAGLAKDAAHSLRAQALRRWGELEPTTALRWLAAQNPVPDPFQAEMWEMGGQWATRQPREALAFALDLLARPDSPPALIQSLLGWRSGTDPLFNVRMALAMAPGREVGLLIETPLTSAQAAEFGQMLAGSGLNFNNDQTRTNATGLASVLRQHWLNTDAPGWLAWAAAHPQWAALLGNQSAEDHAIALRSTPPGQQASAADRWLAALPEPDRAPAMKRILENWSAQDMEAAGTWLATQPDTPARWDAAEAYATASVTSDPLAGWQWVAAIPDPGRRRSAERKFFTAWRRSDPAAAGAWLAQQPWEASQLRDLDAWLAVEESRGR